MVVVVGAGRAGYLVGTVGMEQTVQMDLLTKHKGRIQQLQCSWQNHPLRKVSH